MTLTHFIWGLTAGICIAAVYLYVIKKICGGFVKALNDNGCIGQENAKSCEEMGINPPNAFLKKQLGENGGMSTMVNTVEGDKYFIPEEKLTMANKKYRYESSNIFMLIGLLAVIIAAGAVASILVPTIIDSIGELF